MNSTNQKQALVQQALVQSVDPSLATVSDLFLLTVLIDKSGSMNTTDKINGIIDGQISMLKAFEGSSTIAKAGLRIQQWMFDTQVNLLNGFVPLDSPNLVKLEHSNYNPAGGTALYDTVIAALSTSQAYANKCRQQGFSVRSLLAILSDGEDTASQAEALEAQQAVEEDTQQGGTAVYVGIGGDDHQVIGQSMGIIPENILLVGNSAKEIRRAFELVSSKSAKIINE